MSSSPTTSRPDGLRILFELILKITTYALDSALQDQSLVCRHWGPTTDRDSYLYITPGPLHERRLVYVSYSQLACKLARVCENLKSHVEKIVTGHEPSIARRMNTEAADTTHCRYHSGNCRARRPTFDTCCQPFKKKQTEGLMQRVALDRAKRQLSGRRPTCVTGFGGIE